MDPLQRLSEFNTQNITTKKNKKKKKTRGTENNGKEKKILREPFYPLKLA